MTRKDILQELGETEESFPEYLNALSLRDIGGAVTDLEKRGFSRGVIDYIFHTVYLHRVLNDDTIKNKSGLIVANVFHCEEHELPGWFVKFGDFPIPVLLLLYANVGMSKVELESLDVELTSYRKHIEEQEEKEEQNTMVGFATIDGDNRWISTLDSVMGIRTNRDGDPVVIFSHEGPIATAETMEDVRCKLNKHFNCDFIVES